jgi:hypothetical protein
MNISLEPANLSRREADLALRVSDPMMNSGGGDYIASRAGTLNFAAYCLDGTASQADIKNGVQAWTSLDYVVGPANPQKPCNDKELTANSSSAFSEKLE